MSVLITLLLFAAGALVGILTGLVPGIHVNVVAAIMAAIAPSLSSAGVPPVAMAAFIVGVAVTHAFFDIVPSLFTGVPTSESYALLPGPKLVMQGKGIEALRLAVFGSWRGLLFGLGVAIVLLGLRAAGMDLVGAAEASLKPFLAVVLTVISVILIVSDERRGWALAIFLASGVLGLIVFSSALVPNGPDAPFSGLFPALSGLFGVSGLVLALREKTGTLPPQEPDPASDLGTGLYSGAAMLGGAGGIAVGLLPGLGAANAATLFSVLGLQEKTPGDLAGKRYIVSTSAINATDSMFGIAALYFLGKSRSGASVAIESFLPKVDAGDLVILLAAMVIAGAFARGVLVRHGAVFARTVARFDHRGMTWAILAFVTLLVALTTGPWGIVILAAATSLGLVAPLAGARRANAMGFFLVPVILFFSGWEAPVVSFLRLEAIALPQNPINLVNVGLAFCLAAAAGAAAYGVGRSAGRL